MSSKGDNDGPGNSWVNSGTGPDMVDLMRQGQARLKRSLPSRPPRGLIIIALLIAAVFIEWTAYYTVPSDSVDVVQRFGQYPKDVPAGLHFKLPLGIDIAIIVPVKRQLKQEFGFTTPGARECEDRCKKLARYWLSDLVRVSEDV